MTTTTLDAIRLETGANPTASVIWMHGLGANGWDFASIVRELDLTGCPSIRFIFPHAPKLPVTINDGYLMPAWYDVLSWDRGENEDEAGLRESEAAIGKLIAQERERGIASEKIVLAGFSQGCAMTLQVGLRYPEKLAGMMCLSGYLPLSGKVADERHPANQDASIFMAHGKSDQVIKFDLAESSRDVLTKLGYKVEWHAYAMQHSVCMEEVTDIAAWLKKVLS
jgi:phospholipase/carboxylesterase